MRMAANASLKAAPQAQMRRARWLQSRTQHARVKAADPSSRAIAAIAQLRDDASSGVHN